MEHSYNYIYNSSKNLLVKLLETGKSIVLYGRGGCGKTYLINEVTDTIKTYGYLVENEENITMNLFDGKYVIAISQFDKIKNIKEDSYYLINMNDAE